MQKTMILIFILGFNYLQAQTIDHKDFSDEKMNHALFDKIQQYRTIVNLPSIEENDILNQAANHHTTYMRRSTIVSHYQEMNLPHFKNIHSPKERIKHFAGDLFEEQNKYAEICLGVTIKNAKTYQELAEKITESIIESENFALLHNGEARHIGLDVQRKKNMYFITINFGMGYNNIIAFKDE